MNGLKVTKQKCTSTFEEALLSTEIWNYNANHY